MFTAVAFLAHEMFEENSYTDNHVHCPIFQQLYSRWSASGSLTLNMSLLQLDTVWLSNLTQVL